MNEQININSLQASFLFNMGWIFRCMFRFYITYHGDFRTLCVFKNAKKKNCYYLDRVSGKCERKWKKTIKSLTREASDIFPVATTIIMNFTGLTTTSTRKSCCNTCFTAQCHNSQLMWSWTIKQFHLLACGSRTLFCCPPRCALPLIIELVYSRFFCCFSLIYL